MKFGADGILYSAFGGAPTSMDALMTHQKEEDDGGQEKGGDVVVCVFRNFRP